MSEIEKETPAFKEWVRSIFAHPVTTNPWYWSAEPTDPDAETCIDHLTKLFSAPEILDEYLDEQVRDGLYFLISNGCSSYTVALSDAKVPLQKRIACVDSMSILFSKFLNRRCSPHLSHLDQTGANPINSVTYMWWDIIPLCGHPNDRAYEELDEAALTMMQSTLNLESIACQESALHGLGHWHMFYSDRVSETIDLYLKHREKQLSPELIRYAKSARQGCVN